MKKRSISKTICALGALACAFILPGCSQQSQSSAVYKTGQSRGWDTPHSGQIRKGAGYSFEGVPQTGPEGGFTLFLYDDKQKPIDVAKSQGARGALISGSIPIPCQMQQSGSNSFYCKASFADEVNLKALIYVGLPTGEIAKVDFDFLMDARPDDLTNLAK